MTAVTSTYLIESRLICLPVVDGLSPLPALNTNSDDGRLKGHQQRRKVYRESKNPGGKGAGKFDLYSEDITGDIYVKPKGQANAPG